MKRWNQKGSRHAKVRMAELRERKLRLKLSGAIRDWAERTGNDERNWWTLAQAFGLEHRIHSGLNAIDHTKACIAFLERALKTEAV